MHLFNFSATALIAAATLAGATTPDTYGQAAAAPPSYNSLTSATTTYTTTRTVLRVVETLTATRNGSTSAFTTTSSSTETATVPIMTATGTGAISYPNGTSTVLGTGAGPTGSAGPSYIPPPQATGAASQLGVEAFGIAALAGLIGLAVF